MAANRSETCCYPSSYGGGWITAAQRVAEIVCERQAVKKGRRLPEKFWSDAEWRVPFRRQILLAEGLLKLYSPAALLKAIQSKSGSKIYSLTAEWLDPICREEQRAIDIALKNAESAPEIPVPAVPQGPRQSTGNHTSMRQKLKDL